MSHSFIPSKGESMRRPSVLSIALALVAVALPGAVHAAEPISAKVATVAPEGTPWAEQFKSFRTRLDKETNGGLKLKAYMGGALGDEIVTASETKRGAIQIWGGSTGALATLVPELALFELPYLFRNVKEADYVIDEVINEDLDKLLASRGFVVLFWSENGYRSFGTTFGPVKTPEQLKGKKMRSQESDVHIEMYRALGASPVPIAVTEVLSSLQTNVVDGFDNTPLFTFAASWHQGIKHFTLTEAIYQPGIVVANKAWFDKLPPEYQKLLKSDPKGASREGRAGVRQLTPLLVENFKGAGITVHSVTPAEKDVLAKLTEKVHDKWAVGKGKSAAPMLKKVKAALAEFRKKNP